MKFHPLTPERWPDFERLFGPRGACGGYWCIVWRAPKAELERGKGDGNRRAVRELVESGMEPGILGYADGDAVAWCSVAPREAFVRLRKTPSLAPVEDQPFWGITCFFVHRKWRRTGVSADLLKTAAEFVRGRGGRSGEGYTVIAKVANIPDAFAWTGVVPAFEKAGFQRAVSKSGSRPVMRLQL